MWTTAFCTRGGNVPQRTVRIDLAPHSAMHFTRSRGGQDRKLESARGDSIDRAQLLHERWHMLPRHCRQMFDAALSGCREQIFKMPAPTRRVIAAAIPCDRRPIQDRFDPAT